MAEKEYIELDKPITVTDTRGIEHEITVRHIFEMNKGKYEVADVRPVVRGKWNNIIQGIIPSGQCSNCKAWDKVTRFCPNCGADMRKES